MEPEVEQYLQEMQIELDNANREKRQMANTQMSLYGGSSDENLIKWQLDLKEDLEKIYHLLRGDELSEDANGNHIYVKQTNCDLKPLNEFGTQMIMNIMQFYLNRNTILSNYDEDTINYKVYDFGIRLSDLFHNRYEEMMMTTSFEEEFEKLYPGYDLKRDTQGRVFFLFEGKTYNLNKEMLEAVNRRLDEHLLGKMKMCDVLAGALVDCVHSAYLRALKGLERSELRTARTVSQNDNGLKGLNYPVTTSKGGLGSAVRKMI